MSSEEFQDLLRIRFRVKHSVDLFLFLSANNHHFHQMFQLQSFSDPAVAGEELFLSGIEVIVENNQYERSLYFLDDEVGEVVELSIAQKRHSQM